MHSESSGSNVVRGFFWVHSRVAESESESESARVGGFWVVGVGVGVGVGGPANSGVGVGVGVGKKTIRLYNPDRMSLIFHI